MREDVHAASCDSTHINSDIYAKNDNSIKAHTFYTHGAVMYDG
jgi:hypothetical protein